MIRPRPAFLIAKKNRGCAQNGRSNYQRLTVLWNSNLSYLFIDVYVAAVDFLSLIYGFCCGDGFAGFVLPAIPLRIAGCYRLESRCLT